MSVIVSSAVGCSFQQLARQPAVPRAQLQNLGIGHVGHLVERDVREFLVVAEELARPLQGPDHTALDAIVDVVAVEILQPVGLQAAVQTGGIRPAAGHAVNVD